MIRPEQRYRSAIIGAVALGLVACATVTEGDEFDYALVKRSKIFDGVTGMEEIQGLFGRPYSVEKTQSGSETWLYYFKEVRGDTQYIDRRLTIRFDERGTVTDHRYTSKTGCTRPIPGHTCS
jgi:hypothetical protein